MRVPLSWLLEFCPTDQSAERIAVALTEHGVEVESIHRPWEGIRGVVVGRVLEVSDHPNADTLVLATVDAGGDERRVVVGVRNMGPGDLVPYAPPGATLPGLEGALERRKIRGEVSEGMLCSPRELGISDDHSGILVLEEGNPGESLVGLLGLDDQVLEVEVHPNRPDLLSVVGVARELAAAIGGDLRLPDMTVVEGEAKAVDAATVDVLDAERCPRYVARVIRGVRVGPSPLAAQVRLAACGMRPLWNVVDATNYVLLEMGQPMHPFDLPALRGSAIVVRRAAPGERLVTLDGEERLFGEEDLLIADAERGVAVAGVMGGGETEVTTTTSDVLLESAYFQPRGVLRTSRRLGLKTEASIRFERGVDPESVAPAAARAAALIAGWSGGTVLSGEVDVGEVPPRRNVAVRPARASRLLGMKVSAADAVEAMGLLRIPASERDEAVEAEVPGYRVDLQIEADLIEEIGRIRGYANLPSTLPGARQAGGLTREQRVRRRVRDALAAAGFHEVASVSFASRRDLTIFEDGRAEGVRVANPMSEEEGYLRSSLLPGLLRAAALSLGQRRPSARLFEAGHVMRAGDGGPLEHENVAAVAAGPVGEEWPSSRDQQGFPDAKGALEHLSSVVGLSGWLLDEPAGPPYHPGRSAAILLGEERIGEVGELHPRAAEAFGLELPVAALELRTAPLIAASSEGVTYRPISRFPPVHRDLAFVVDREVDVGVLAAALVKAAGPLLDRVALFDIYEGDPLPPGKKSLAFSVDFRSVDRTLTDDEINEVVRAMADGLASGLGAELRSG